MSTILFMAYEGVPSWSFAVFGPSNDGYLPTKIDEFSLLMGYPSFLALMMFSWNNLTKSLLIGDRDDIHLIMEAKMLLEDLYG